MKLLTYTTILAVHLALEMPVGLVKLPKNVSMVYQRYLSDKVKACGTLMVPNGMVS